MYQAEAETTGRDLIVKSLASTTLTSQDQQQELQGRDLMITIVSRQKTDLPEIGGG
jgi:hypothetical protein